MANNQKRRERTVSEVMSSPVVKANPDETIAEVASRMTDRKVGSVVVADGDRPVGILTERDLVRFSGVGIDPSTAKVSEWMTADPDTVTPETEVAKAFGALAERGYRHMPVVSDGNLVGIVSIRDLVKISQIIPVEQPAIEVPRGLEGVAVAETTVGDVRGEEGFYHYRQYDATVLNEKRPLEDVWHLVLTGSLPSLAERAAFMEQIRPLREIPVAVKEILPVIANAGEQFQPLEALRTAYSHFAAALDFRSWMDISREELYDQAMRTCAVVPTLLMNLYRLHAGKEIIDPDPELGYAANYLYMLKGERPTELEAWAIERYLISTIDHGFNASTFTARVVASTGADLGSAVVAAIGALSGPLHGGAPSRALATIDAIGTPDNADRYLRDMVSRGERIMGFGHRVYRTDDPRSVLLRRVAEKLGGDLVDFAKEVERTAVKVLQELKPGRKLYTNVEFYGGVVMETVGLPREMFTPTFTSSRVIGWTAHVLEQASDNRLIRPAANYIGPPPPQPVPDAQ